MADDFGFFSSSEGAGAEEDPAAAFLAQQESEIAGIENDEGFGPTDGEAAAAPGGQAAPPEQGEHARGGRPAALPLAAGGLPTLWGNGGLCPLLPRRQGRVLWAASTRGWGPRGMHGIPGG